MSFFSGKKIFLLGFLVVLLFAIPLTVFLTQKSQQVTTKAAPTTTLTFVPPTKTANVGDTVSLDVMMNPGSNSVSFVKLTLTYDATKFSVDQTSGLAPNSTPAGPFTVLQGPTYTSGNVTVTLSVGADPAKVIIASTRLATINLKAIAGTSGSTTPVVIDKDQTQVLSIASPDQANENVLAGKPDPALITINGGAASTPSTNKVPVCSSLVLDRAATGAAPYSLTFTAAGKDEDGTITKVSFSFGDGQTSDVTTGGGIGTNTVNTQIAHTYQNPGTFTASAVLTDNQTATSVATSCTTTITVTSASGASTGGAAAGSGTAVVPTATATVVPTVIPTKALAPTGPGDKIIGIGTIGIILSILGGLLLAL